MPRDQLLQLRLLQFLDSGRCPQHSMNFYQLDGYLRALALAPGKSSEDDWRPLIFNDSSPDYQDAQQERDVADWLAQLREFHRNQVAAGQCNLPCDAVYASLPEERVDLEQWARGFLQGYIVREEVWSGAINRVTSSCSGHKIGDSGFFDELDAILYIVSTVADAKYAVQMGTKAEELGAIFASLPDALGRASQLKIVLDDMTLVGG